MENTAAMHYLVERIESDLLTKNRMIAWRAAHLPRGNALIVPSTPDASRPLVMPEADAAEIARNSRGDLVRILDREGNVVWWHEFRSRESSVKKHSEIMDDLMKIDAAAFRAKYGIIPERPLEVDASGADPSAHPPGSAADPNGPWGDPWGDRVRRSEGGSEWKPSSDAGGRREDDIPWGDQGRT